MSYDMKDPNAWSDLTVIGELTYRRNEIFNLAHFEIVKADAIKAKIPTFIMPHNPINNWLRRAHEAQDLPFGGGVQFDTEETIAFL